MELFHLLCVFSFIAPDSPPPAFSCSSFVPFAAFSCSSFLSCLSWKMTLAIRSSSSSLGARSLCSSLASTNWLSLAHYFKLSAINSCAKPSNFLLESRIWLYCVLKITLYWIWLTSSFCSLLSPMLNFSIQKLVLSAFPIEFPPSLVIEHPKTSSSCNVVLLSISLAMALDPRSPMSLFRRNNFVRHWFFFNDLHNNSVCMPSILQSAMLRSSI